MQTFSIPEEWVKDFKEPRHYIGIGRGIDSGIENSSYCLVRYIYKNDKLLEDVLLTKTIKDKNEFEKEVDNLAVYFNAKKVE